MSKDLSSSADVCPVDPVTRSVWLKSNGQKQIPFPVDIPASSKPTSASCDSSSINQNLPPSLQSTPTTSPTKNIFSRLSFWASSSPSPPSSTPGPNLSNERVISSIPRSSTVDKNKAANNEVESGESADGKWIYPSEKMFFDAMRRKGHGGEERDMRTIVPIHNAVNERAWKEIREWERPWGGESCGGPRLHSFLGLGGGPNSANLSPKARFNSLLGYTEPFDRHDWVVDRCGKKVEYIIDFYSGSAEGKGGKAGKLNFYLDVRPKLNSWEGWKMRGARGLGLV